MSQSFSNHLLLMLFACYFIKKSYTIASKGMTYFSTVNDQVEIVYEFYPGEKLREWVVSGLTLGNCSFTRPLEGGSFKINSISCTERTTTLKLTYLANKRLTFICYTDSCSPTPFTIEPLHNDDGDNTLRSMSGTAMALMEKNFTLVCDFGDSPVVRWYLRSGLLLAWFNNCEKTPGNLTYFYSPVRFTCNLISRKSTFEFGPVNLKDGNFTIVCSTEHHGSEFKVSTIDTRNLTVHDAGTVTVTGDQVVTLLCPLEEGDTLTMWKGNDSIIGNCSGGFKPVHPKYETIGITCSPGGSTLKLFLPTNTTELNIQCESYRKKRRVYKLIHKAAFRAENIVIILLAIILLVILIANSVCFFTKPGREFCIQQALLSTTNDPDFESVTEESDASKNI